MTVGFVQMKTLGVAWALVSAMTVAQAQTARCGPMVEENQYGPYNYVTQNDKVALVDRFHFPPHVEALLRPKSRSYGGDLTYTLQRIPNHHRALITLYRLGVREKSPQPTGLGHPIDCYFDFAVQFAPKDLVTKMIYAQHLAATGRSENAISMLTQVSLAAEDNPFTHFNVGMIYFEMKRYDLARAQALKASALGLNKPELIDLLKQAGQWQDQ